ncbi:fructosamine kinase family protein [Actinoallomurus spadix]|uniref:Fructosamine kinase family protein n=1 Tax=Actinoallomurus spadix TaxID=79912 RepID=A0ABN0WFK9_9ACTN|nr:fructosamine kinase family protein [Actinoallomurus spadix]MCO5987417.1 fructosamine kinase family protein [Actinoallomurus spadix]
MDRLLGTPIAEVTDLGTSHEWSLRRATLTDGRRVFVKEARRRIDGLFAAEAAGLRWLAEGWRHVAGDDAPGPVPEVLAADETTLVLPWIDTAAPTDEAAERFGRELAALHGAGAESYGAPWRGYIAELPLDNTAGASWPEWYAERRVLPYVRMAVDRGVLSSGDAAEIERAAARIPDVAGPAEPPARIHGDLWSGNVLWGRDRAWLVDPAAHAGHRETDLAMLALFGAPRLERILAAYDEAAPLAGAWRARVPLHQLHPLLVHVVLFGGAYRGQALAAARSIGRL